MKPGWMAPMTAGFFGLVSTAFLISCTSPATSNTRKVRLRIAIIFAAVALAIFAFRPR